MRLSEYEKNWSKSVTVEMIFITAKERIEGQFHKTSKVRVSDELTNARDFIFLTDVKVFSLEDKALLLDTEFLAVNKAAIIFAMEKNSTRVHQQDWVN